MSTFKKTFHNVCNLKIKNKLSPPFPSLPLLNPPSKHTLSKCYGFPLPLEIVASPIGKVCERYASK